MRGKIFTVAEANALLPRARAAMGRVRAAGAAARRRADRIAVLGVLWGARVRDPSHTDHAEYRRHGEALARIRRRVERLVAREITARGIRFPPGGIEHGLLDFPSTLDGRRIYLCWQDGEGEVEFWHDTHAGFAGRRPITSEQAARIGRGS
jgi:hypothetical protein